MIESMTDKEFSEKEIVAFEERYLAAFQQLSHIANRRKWYEDEEKKAKAAIQKIMDEYGIKSIDNQYMKITRVSAGERQIDRRP